jgi:hypothetical protein
LLSAAKTSLPRTEITTDRVSVRVCVRLVHRKAEHLALPGPFRCQVGQASNAHAMWEAAIDSAALTRRANGERALGATVGKNPFPGNRDRFSRRLRSKAQCRRCPRLAMFAETASMEAIVSQA